LRRRSVAGFNWHDDFIISKLNEIGSGIFVASGEHRGPLLCSAEREQYLVACSHESIVSPGLAHLDLVAFGSEIRLLDGFLGLSLCPGRSAVFQHLVL